MDRSAAVDRARAYYTSVDEGRFDRLEDLLHPSFEQRRPDRRFDDRDEFVSFMRENRPMPEATHDILGLFAATDEDSVRVATQGELIDPDGHRLFGFVDVHEFDGGRIARLTTYTD